MVSTKPRPQEKTGFLKARGGCIFKPPQVVEWKPTKRGCATSALNLRGTIGTLAVMPVSSAWHRSRAVAASFSEKMALLNTVDRGLPFADEAYQKGTTPIKIHPGLADSGFP